MKKSLPERLISWIMIHALFHRAIRPTAQASLATNPCCDRLERVPLPLRDTVKEIVGHAEAVVDGDTQPLCVAEPDIEALTLLTTERVGDKVTEELEVNESETVEDCDRVNDEEEHMVLDNDEDAQPLWVPLPDEEPQGLTVKDVEGERVCVGDEEKLCVVVALPVSVKEIDGLAEVVTEGEKHPLGVELCVIVAQ